MSDYRSVISSIALAATLFTGGICLSQAQAADIIDEWANVKMPSAPELKAVTIDPKTTVLLMLDFLQGNCGHRPTCLAEMPAMKKLLDAARGAGAMIIYSGFEKSTPSDVIKDIAPPANEPMIHSNADKFLNTDLDKMLKDKGIKTVIVVGTAANGGVLYTAGEAALRGYKVIVPVDGLSADDLYAVQFTVWNLVHATPTFVNGVTLTTSDMIKF
jgi:nicotinamidase-related amidase